MSVDLRRAEPGADHMTAAPDTSPVRARPSAESSTPFWSEPLDALWARIGSSPRGLTRDEAARRLRELGPASLRHRTSSSSGRILLRQFANPLVILLTIAAVLSFVVGERVDSGIIIVVVIAGGLLGFWQEHRAVSAVEQLLSLVRTTTTVVRDGAPVTVPLEEVGPGDIVVLAAGATMPGDCRLIECRDLFIDESALTGESFPVA